MSHSKTRSAIWSLVRLKILLQTYELENIKALHEEERRQAEALGPERERMRKICQQLNKKHDELFSQVCLSV